MKDLLVVDNLSYEVLDNISFSLKKNTLNALIGKSSCGKSTLLKCIAGLYKFKGNITINSNVIDKSSITNNYVSLFTPELIELNETPFESIMDSVDNTDIEIAKKKVYSISNKLGIDDLLYKNIETLSYSEKKMVGIAKTLVTDSDLVLLDNVFDSLDLNYKNKVIDYFKKMNNMTIIFTTNNPEDLMLVDNIIIMDKGNIVEIGTKEDLFQKENIFIKNELKLPFIVDLSHKLKIYGLVNHLVYKSEDMVNQLWK